jgi:uncharacterized Ntn-hydrolase superfamily protein
MLAFPSRLVLLRALWITSLTVIVCGTPAFATYSIAACDAKTHSCGVAVQTNNLAVGASVPFAKAGVGAGVSQFETNPHYGPRALVLLEQGKAPAQVIEILLQEDASFDGEGPEARQVGVVSLDGRSYVHSGEEALENLWAGSRTGPGYTIQGNSLAGPEVLTAMENAFLKSDGSLEERLLRALVAGDAAGGQKTGRESAALLVKTEDGWPIDIDLRVDHSANPVADLQTLFNMQYARKQLGQARRAAQQGRAEEAKALMMQAVARASEWSRIWLQAARLAYQLGEDSLSLQYLSVAFSENPAWKGEELGHGRYPALGSQSLFHTWLDSADRRQLLQKSQQLMGCDSAQKGNRLQIAAEFLEAGLPQDALRTLGACPDEFAQDAKAQTLLTEVSVEAGNRDEARAHCHTGLQLQPGDTRLLVLRKSLEDRQGR